MSDESAIIIRATLSQFANQCSIEELKDIYQYVDALILVAATREQDYESKAKAVSQPESGQSPKE